MEAIAVLIVIVAAFAIPRYFKKKEENETREFFRRHIRVAVARFWEVFEEHADELARARAQLVRTDRYGVEVREAWDRELEYFLNRVVRPALTGVPAEVLDDVLAECVREVDQALDDRAELQDDVTALPPDITPVEYEVMCAELLARAGWEARTTKGSGDQGADVIATKSGRRLVLQCKLYSRPVGNHSVQEVVAAKLHEGADLGAVVSNSGYTPSARQLAQTTGTLLLHHSELPSLDARVGIAS